jgi:hypothetical protein
MALGGLIRTHRKEILSRCRAKVIERSGPPPSSKELAAGIPLFVDQLLFELEKEPVPEGNAKPTPGASENATKHGHALFASGYTIGQLVHDYGDVCQSVTDLAVELSAPVTTEDFRTLNRCLDLAIADAVAAFADHERATNDDDALQTRNLVYTAVTGFEVLRGGTVGISGTTGDMVHRSLLLLQTRLGRLSS